MNPVEAKEKCLEIYFKIFGDTGNVHFDVPEPIDYRKERDIICVVVDRDSESRSPSKCDDFFRRCQAEGFEPYMSNPSFEMWLLLHFDEVLREDKQKLRLNKKMNDVRYAEKRLGEILQTIPANRGKGYSKNNLNFDDFIDRVDNAIINERMYCNDIKCLKIEVGSNLGLLIEKMRLSD